MSDRGRANAEDSGGVSASSSNTETDGLELFDALVRRTPASGTRTVPLPPSGRPPDPARTTALAALTAAPGAIKRSTPPPPPSQAQTPSLTSRPNGAPPPPSARGSAPPPTPRSAASGAPDKATAPPTPPPRNVNAPSPPSSASASLARKETPKPPRPPLRTRPEDTDDLTPTHAVLTDDLTPTHAVLDVVFENDADDVGEDTPTRALDPSVSESLRAKASLPQSSPTGALPPPPMLSASRSPAPPPRPPSPPPAIPARATPLPHASTPPMLTPLPPLPPHSRTPVPPPPSVFPELAAKRPRTIPPPPPEPAALAQAGHNPFRPRLDTVPSARPPSLAPVTYSATLPPSAGRNRARMAVIAGLAASVLIGVPLLLARSSFGGSLASSGAGNLIVTIAGPGSTPISMVNVAIDDIARCAGSPCRVDMKAGTHFVQVSAPGYQSTTGRAVVVRAGEETVLNVELERTVSAHAAQNATSPDSLPLEPNSVAAALPPAAPRAPARGYAPSVAAAPHTAPVSRAPRPSAPEPAANTPASLTISSTPPSAVLLDGKPMGLTPLNGVSVTPGKHTVTFVHPERGRQTVSADVAAGEKRAVSARFPEPPPDSNDDE